MLLSFLSVFILVVSLVQSWKYFKILFYPQFYNIWFFHEESARLPTPFISDQLSFTIMLPSLFLIRGKNTFPITVYGHITIGLLFYYFLKIQKDYNLIEFDEAFEEKQGWMFYLLSSSGKRKRLLNPVLTLRENGVKQDGLIEAVILRK